MNRPGTGRALAGAALVALFWWVNWQSFRLGPVTVWAFFPLWLGYILLVDGLTQCLFKTSICMRGRARFVQLFLFSIPVWWLFEYFNRFLGNWEYRGAENLPYWAYLLFASISFSTVIPAVFVTTELVSHVLPDRLERGPRLALSPRALASALLLGLVLFALITTYPHVFYPTAWLCVVLIVDPVVHLAGWPSLSGEIARGNWRLPLALGMAALLCGFFWEMWNFHSQPKWVYHIPYLGFGKIFEMPVLGYGGYLPFGLEVYTLYRLLDGIAGRQPGNELRLGEAGP